MYTKKKYSLRDMILWTRLEIFYFLLIAGVVAVLYELAGVNEQQAKVCFARLAAKMPVPVRMVRRRPA